MARRRLDTGNNENCFFCGENVHQCKTLETHVRVENMAKEMADVEVLEQLSKDIVVDAYHVKCLTEYNNKYRSFTTPEKVSKERSLIEGMATIQLNCNSISYIIVLIYRTSVV